MNTSTNLLRSHLQDLREDYAAHLPGKIADIETAWDSCLRDPTDTASLDTFHRKVHSLVGSSATFGFPDISTAARIVEQAVKQIQTSDLSQVSQHQHHMIEVLTTLGQVAAEAVTQAPEDMVTEKNEATADRRYRQTEQLVYLVEEDSALAHDLQRNIRQFGYTVEILQHPNELHLAIKQSAPAAVILDTSSQDDLPMDLKALLTFDQDQQTHIPLMFISAHDDLPARLQAVRAGGEAYFTKPLEVSRLVDQLDALTAQHTPDPYRILIVDDETAMSNYYASILQQQGMLTKTVDNPLLIMHALAEFKADLILMDLYMPSCSGLELAKVIRQQEAYVSIPIVFLSAETDIDKQMAALQLGSDDFLTKPIEHDHLIASVVARVQRSRTLQSFMVRDSLTGLYNHTKLKEQLRTEVARAGRYNTRLSFVMIDIDHFKQINDTYGHASGDRVIKNLARLLKQRLRKTDIIGRYGGEEFAVILTETGGTGARQVIDELRVSFAQILHQSEQETFSVTFSAGIATYPPCTDTASLSDVADRALYAAKRSGRNQVLLSEDVYLE